MDWLKLVLENKSRVSLSAINIQFDHKWKKLSTLKFVQLYLNYGTSTNFKV